MKRRFVPPLELMLASHSESALCTVPQSQAELLTGLAVPDLSSAYKAVEVLQSYNPGCVVLTLGEKGVLFTEIGKPDIIKHQEAEKVEVVDTTVSQGSVV